MNETTIKVNGGKKMEECYGCDGQFYYYDNTNHIELLGHMWCQTCFDTAKKQLCILRIKDLHDKSGGIK